MFVSRNLLLYKKKLSKRRKNEKSLKQNPQLLNSSVAFHYHSRYERFVKGFAVLTKRKKKLLILGEILKTNYQN